MERGKKFLLNIIKYYFRRSVTSGAEGLGELGCGAGKGGGSGGTIREAGGSMGKFGAANEEVYFYKRQREQLLALKKELEKQNDLYGGKVQEYREKIDDNRKRVDDFEKCFDEKMAKK